MISIKIINIKPILNLDTINFNIPNNIDGLAGINKINVKIELTILSFNINFLIFFDVGPFLYVLLHYVNITKQLKPIKCNKLSQN